MKSNIRLLDLSQEGKRMRYKIYLLIILVNAIVGVDNSASGQKITDTIFYNNYWQICEKPIASYYRLGTLVIDSFWYYTGKFRDYDMDGHIQMEGEYNNIGEKNGLFRFYYPDGKLMISGKFWQNLMIDEWQWYYSNDSLRAVINFDGPSGDFSFIKFKQPDGTTTLEEGSGKFEWYTNAYATGWYNIKVYGSYSGRKRSGTWKYFLVGTGDETYRFEEKYDKEGQFKKANISGAYYGEVPKSRYSDYAFIPPKVWITEQIQYDKFFNTRPGSGDLALLNYLLNRKTSEVIVKNGKVENAILQIILSLDANRNRLEYQQKEVDGNIEFKIGEKGLPEDIVVSGTGINDKEKEFIIFLVSKFRQIEMPGIETVAIESYYSIKFYSINIKEFMPAAMRDQVNNDIFFSTLPKDKFLILMRSAKKKIKKYVRDQLQFYW